MAQIGKPLLQRRGAYERLKDVGLEGSRRYSVFGFQDNALVGDRRRTGASMAHGHNGRVPFLLDLPVEPLVAFGIDAVLASYLNVNLGVVLR